MVFGRLFDWVAVRVTKQSAQMSQSQQTIPKQQQHAESTLLVDSFIRDFVKEYTLCNVKIIGSLSIRRLCLNCGYYHEHNNISIDEKTGMVGHQIKGLQGPCVMVRTERHRK
jgi:hypothetical protein